MNAASVSPAKGKMEEGQQTTHIFANDCAINGKRSGDQEKFRGEFLADQR